MRSWRISFLFLIIIIIITIHLVTSMTLPPPAPSTIVALNVQVQVKPGCVSAFQQAADRNVVATRQEEGCLQIVYGRKDDDDHDGNNDDDDGNDKHDHNNQPTTFYFHDQFRNDDAYTLHQGLPHFTKFVQETKDMLVAPPVVHKYHLYDVVEKDAAAAAAADDDDDDDDDNQNNDKKAGTGTFTTTTTTTTTTRYCLNVESQLQPAHRDAYYQLMTNHARCSRAEAGCTQFDWGLDDDDNGNVYMHEEYTDEEAFAAHQAAAHFAKFVQFNQEKQPYTQPQAVHFYKITN